MEDGLTAGSGQELPKPHAGGGWEAMPVKTDYSHTPPKTFGTDCC